MIFMDRISHCNSWSCTCHLSFFLPAFPEVRKIQWAGWREFLDNSVRVLIFVAIITIFVAMVDVITLRIIEVLTYVKEPKLRWYIIQTYSGYENAVATDLRRRVESMGMTDYILESSVPEENILKKIRTARTKKRFVKSSQDMSL